VSTTAEIAARIATDIETLGHYQAHLPRSSFNCVCIITAPGWPRNDDTAQNDLLIAICEKVGLPVEVPLDPVIRWNDTTPTEEVIETLRSL